MSTQINKTYVKNLINKCIDLLAQISITTSELQGSISQLILMNPSDTQIINLNTMVSKITGLVDNLKMKLNIESGSILRDASSNENVAFGIVMFYELIQYLYDISLHAADNLDITNKNLSLELKKSFEYILQVSDIAKSIFNKIQNHHTFDSKIINETISSLLRISEKHNISSILKLNLDAINKLNEVIVLSEDSFSNLFIEYINKKLEIEQQVIDLEKEFSNISKTKVSLEKLLKKLKSNDKCMVDANAKKIVHTQFVQNLIEEQVKSGGQIDLNEISKKLGISQKIMLPIIMRYTNKCLANLIEDIDSALNSL